MENKLKIYNGKILTPYRIISGTVVVVDGKIKEVAEGNIDVSGAVEIDAKGIIFLPALSIFMFTEVVDMISWMDRKKLF